ncbi:MAG: 23S rRNA (uracil(1939)-C(5))-methyltransferase RlmD [Deltaproteobacteria bacterium]|nr:23S rRNA (uracil(1939)-C(5))-methyltransferase RlmD [Deltaproteobacteria bacterium]
MEIQIEKLAFGGAGIGRTAGKVVFVRGGLPGDVVKVRITKEKGSYAEAEIEEIVSSSPERTKPPCPVFGKCGGCQWQHLTYFAQLKAKEGILRETLERIGGLKYIEIDPIVPSPKEYGYRDRVTLSIRFEKGSYLIGYHEERSRRQIEIEGCPIASKPIDETIFRLSKSLSSMSTARYLLEKVHITSDEKIAYITLVPGWEEDPKRLNSFRNQLKKSLETEIVCIAGDDEREYEFTILGLKFYSIPSLFIQANREIHERLVETLLEWSDLKGDERVLDLYSGIGNFSLHLAKRCEEVVGVDVSAKAVNHAKKSAEANSITNVAFDASPSELFIGESVKRGDRFDLIVLDPPREGAKDILKELAELSPKRIIYVSCDPPTLARDLKTLREMGYRTLKIRPFDMFPQTYHIESIALLMKI